MEKPMEKVVVAFPFYRQIPVAWFFNWMKMDKAPVIGTVATGGIYLPVAMQTLVDLAFKNCPEFERFVIYEADMIPPANGLTRMATYDDKDDYDIVGSIYFKHDYPHHVMGWMQVDKPRFSPLTREVVQKMVENPGLYPVDGVAMGFTSIHRRVFENWDPDISMWYPAPPFVGHDLHFCNEALKQGFKIWLDAGIGCGHLTTIPIGYPDSQEALAKGEPPTWAEFRQNGNGGEIPKVDSSRGILDATVEVIRGGV